MDRNKEAGSNSSKEDGSRNNSSNPRVKARAKARGSHNSNKEAGSSSSHVCSNSSASKECVIDVASGATRKLTAEQ